MKNRLWSLPEPHPDGDRALAERLGTSIIITSILRSRGFTDHASAYAHLNPRLLDLEHPFALKDLERAAERIRTAIANNEPLLVYGDYDVDGMTGAVILTNFIKLAGGTVTTYIPNRLKEGYSFNDEAIDAILGRENPPKAVVTVDHGTSAKEGIRRLKAGGVDVIVTDHHEPPDELPTDAYAIVNPRRRDCTSGFKALCGAAVGYKLAWGAAEAFSGARRVSPEFREFLLESMAMVALATVTDVVPLLGENRILCAHGLRALPHTKNLGLRALLRHSRLEGSVVRAVHLGFRLGPRLNAAGRMGIADKAIELLTTQDSERANKIAAELEEANDRRRSLEQDTLAEVLSMPQMMDFKGDRGICIGKRGWHPGVIGIVAARLVDRFGVPSLVAALNGDQGRCSARCPPGLNLKEMLDDCGEHLAGHGGHALAAGATVTEAKFADFKSAFERVSGDRMRENRTPLRLSIDQAIPFAAIRPELVEELALLQPHGAGNPPPLFVTFGAQVLGKPQLLGKTRKAVAIHLRHGDRTFRAISFEGEGFLARLNDAGSHVDVVYKLKFNDYFQPGNIELEIEDFRKATP